jgi:hypothetical protein
MLSSEDQRRAQEHEGGAGPQDRRARQDGAGGEVDDRAHDERGGHDVPEGDQPHGHREPPRHPRAEHPVEEHDRGQGAVRHHEQGDEHRRLHRHAHVERRQRHPGDGAGHAEAEPDEQRVRDPRRLLAQPDGGQDDHRHDDCEVDQQRPAHPHPLVVHRVERHGGRGEHLAGEEDHRGAQPALVRVRPHPPVEVEQQCGDHEEDPGDDARHERGGRDGVPAGQGQDGADGHGRQHDQQDDLPPPPAVRVGTPVMHRVALPPRNDPASRVRSRRVVDARSATASN